MGSNELMFMVERFNTFVMRDVGKRKSMEDEYIRTHDLNIHPELKISHYCVIDGHGGAWSAEYVKKELDGELVHQFKSLLLAYP